MPRSPDLVVTITPDTSRFDAAMRQAVEHAVRLWAALPLRTRHALWALRHGHRHRARVVTRRKQRSRW